MPEWNGRQPSILPHQIHTRFCLWYIYWKYIIMSNSDKYYAHKSVRHLLRYLFVDKLRYFDCVCCTNQWRSQRGLEPPTGMQSMQNTTLLALLKPIFALKTKIATPIGIGNENVSTLTLDLKRNRSPKQGCGSGNFRIASASTLSVSASTT